MNAPAQTFGRYALLLIRLYLGWSWLIAGWEKMWSPGWHGQAPAVVGFLQGALKASPFVWYKSLIAAVFLPNSGLFAFLVTWGELLVGLALLVGLLTNLAALGAILMNMSFLLAGTVSTNATYIIMELAIIFGASGLIFGMDAVLARRGFRSPVFTADPDRTAAPVLSWITAGALLVLAALAYGSGGTLKLPEFANPAGQLSRLFFFAAAAYAIKAFHDGREKEEAELATRPRAA